MTAKLTTLLNSPWARTLKFLVFLAVFCGYAYFAYEALPNSGCGSCPKRSLRLLGPIRGLHLTEWWHKAGEPDLFGQLREPTWLCIGDWNIHIPFSVQSVILGTLLVSLFWVYFCPSRFRRSRLILFVPGAWLFSAISFNFLMLLVAANWHAGFFYEPTVLELIATLVWTGLHFCAICILNLTLWREFLRIKSHHETLWL